GQPAIARRPIRHRRRCRIRSDARAIAKLLRRIRRLLRQVFDVAEAEVPAGMPRRLLRRRPDVVERRTDQRLDENRHRRRLSRDHHPSRTANSSSQRDRSVAERCASVVARFHPQTTKGSLMRAIRFTAAAAFTACLLAGSAFAANNAETKPTRTSFDKTDLDPTVSACTDFNQYANGLVE